MVPDLLPVSHLDFLDLGTLVMKNIASVINGYSVHPSGSLSTRIGPRTARLQPSGPDANAAPAEPAQGAPLAPRYALDRRADLLHAARARASSYVA